MDHAGTGHLVSDMGSLDRLAYSHGRDPLDWAEFVVWADIDWYLIVLAGHAEDPASFPGVPDNWTDPHALARRIIASLLDAGWTMPDTSQLASRCMKARREGWCVICQQPIKVGQLIAKTGTWNHAQCAIDRRQHAQEDE